VVDDWDRFRRKPLNIVGDKRTRTGLCAPRLFLPLKRPAGATTTLIASYCWTEDASRLGALIDKGDVVLLELVLKELAVHTQRQCGLLRGQFDRLQGMELVARHPYTWVSTFDFTSSAVSQSIYQGAFAFFGPGKFGNLYTSLNQPAAKGYLHFAGEASACGMRGWRVRWTALGELSMKCSCPRFQSYQAKFLQTGGNPEWIKQSATHAPGKIPAGRIVLS